MRPSKLDTPDIAKMMRTLATQQALIQRLKAISALWVVTHNSPAPIAKSSIELFYLLGDILEGIPPDKLQTRLLDKEALLREFTDG